MFKNVKETSWFYIIAAIIAFVVLILIELNLLVQPARSLSEATGGFIQPTLLFALVNFIVIVGGLIWFGKLRLKDFCLSHNKLVPAILLTFGLWLVTNLIILALALFQGSDFLLDDQWQTKGFVNVMGLLIAQVFGNALVEESLFRGFLIPQFYFKFGGSKENKQRMKLVYAAILSLVVFTIPHLANVSNIGAGSVLTTMIVIFVLGAIITVFYFRTENLILTIGFHALINTPTQIFQSPPDLAEMLVVALGIILILLWPLLPEFIRLSHEDV